MVESILITQKKAAEMLKANMILVRKNIYRLMKEQDISQRELGLRIDSDEFYTNYILKHPSPNPSYKKIIAIAAALNTTPIELLK